MGYLHPESYLFPATAGFRDDFYAFGVTLWELLTMQSARAELHAQLRRLPQEKLEQLFKEMQRHYWDVDDIDRCCAAAELWGYISLDQVRFLTQCKESLLHTWKNFG
jgi:hypothetical protein